MDPMILHDDYMIRRDKFTKKWRSNWEAIFRKYDQPYEDDAVIDLENEKIVHNKELIHKIPTQHLGTTLFESTLRRRKKKCKKGHGNSKHESSDSAFESMEPDDAGVYRDTCQQPHHYTALSVFDFTHGDPDETGNCCIRYQYDEKTDAKPTISGPKEICDFDFPVSDDDDDDNDSCASGPVGDSDESWSLLDNDGKPVDVDKYHTSDSKSEMDRDNEKEEKCQSNSVQGECHDTRWNRSDGITTTLEAKNNFLRKIQRYLMMPPESEETGESENDTAATSYSKSKCRYSNEKGGSLFKSPMLTSAHQSSNPANQGRQTAGGLKQANATHSNLEFNECSTILAGNVDDDEPSVDSDCEDAIDDDKVKSVHSSKCLIDLNTTDGGGLKLPTQGAKQIIIGSVPQNQVSYVKVDSPHNSPSTKIKPNTPETPQSSRQSLSQRPFLSCPPKIRPRTPKTSHSPRSRHHMPNSPCTPRNLLSLKSEEMLEILRSPLPLEITPTKGSCKYQGVLSPKLLLAGLQNDNCSLSNSTAVHHDVIKASPLAKTLKKMQQDTEVETNKVRATPPKCKRLTVANETYVVSKTTVPSEEAVEHTISEKTLTHCKMEKSIDYPTLRSQFTDTSSSRSKSSGVNGHHDTFEFQSSESESTERQWRVADDLEKLCPFDEPRQSTGAWKHTHHKTKWKDNKRKLSDTNCDTEEHPPSSQIPKSMTQECIHELVHEEVPNMKRTPKRLKQQNQVLVTSTPIKKGNVSTEEETNVPENSPERKASYSDLSCEVKQYELYANGPVTSTAADPIRQEMKNTSSELNKSSERYTRKCVRKLSNKLDSGTSKAENNQIQSKQTFLSNAHRTPIQRKKQEEKTLATSTLSKKEATNDLEETNSSDLQGNSNSIKPSRIGIVKKSRVGRPATQKSGNLEFQRKQDMCRKSNKLKGKSHKKIDKMLPFKTRSPESKVNTNRMKLSITFGDSSLNSSMSNSFIPCEGPGKCTKMFCFLCSGS